jgi:hypothetical protein
VIQACQQFLDHPLAAKVASACKQIATARLMISGARWTQSGAIATAKARAAWLSHGDGFDTLSRLPLVA